MTEEVKLVKNYLAVSPKEMTLNQQFTGESMDEEVKFPKGLGAKHPFDFEEAEKIIKNVGIVNAMVDKIVDAIVGDYSVTVEDENGQKIIDSFNENSNLREKLRPWVKEAVYKGNGFMELDFDEDNLRTMNANGMYVVRNKKSKVLKYNQFIGNLKTFNLNKTKLIPFKPEQIAHLPINKTPNDPYGMGLLWPNRVTVRNYTSSEISAHKLQERKAGMPIHVKLGQPGESVQLGDIDDFKSKLQFMNNSTEWVTDGNIEMNLIDFNGVLDNSIKMSEHDLEQLSLGMKIPMSILGIGNNPEGLAKVNDKGFMRFISSVRANIEEIIEDKIYKPLLRKNGLSFKINFEWEIQDEDDKNERLKIITETLKNPFISPILKAGLELEYADIVGLDEVKNALPDPLKAKSEAETQARETEEQTIKQPEVPGAKPTANQSSKKQIEETVKTEHKCDESCGCTLTESQASQMSIAEYVNLQEIAGFNYSDYLVKILLNLRTEKFNDLRALTEQQINEGLLPGSDIEKLRSVLNDGFRKNKTISQIEKDIKQSIDLKDRTKLNEEGEEVVTLTSEKRPNAIARTETVRLANAGLKDMYIENDIKSYRYLAALDDRTSDICNSLNGQVFLIKDAIPGVNMPPMHVNCRSSIVGLVD